MDTKRRAPVDGMTYSHVPAELRPLVEAGFEIFPLAPGRKKPRDVGWQRIDYSEFDFARWDGGIGIRLKQNQLVVDGDPRNYEPGDDPIQRLSQDIGFALTTAPTVSTGGGGWHYYLRLPEGVTVRNGSLKEAGYRGVDVKTGGGFVVAPGSIHPDGKEYRLVNGLDHGVPVAPEALIAMRRKMARPDCPPRPGVLDVDEMVECLEVLDVTEFGKGQYERFRDIAMACHDATGGGGLAEFQHWAGGDPDYGSFEDDDMIERMWFGFEAGKEGGITYRTVLAAVAEAGRPDLASRYRAKIELEALPDVEVFESDPRTMAGLDFQIASEVTIEPIRWAWPNRLARGKVNSLSGEAGLSKTTLMMDIAARVTTGAEWPDGSGRAEQGSVIFLSAEDDVADTLVPRFIAAGGDLGKLVLVKPTVQPGGKERQRMFNIGDDIPRLRALATRFPDVRLIVIDPIGAYMGSSAITDSFRDSDVRMALGPLKEFAEATGIAAVFIGHFKKGATGRVQERMMGSVAFTALARCNWVVLAEQDDDERPTGRLLFARSKQNIGEPAGAMAYRIRSAVVDADRGISAPAIDWEGCIEGSADTLVARPRRKGESVKLTEAVSFLTELMEDGSVRASAVEDERHKRGIADKTLRRAKQVLGIQSEQRDDGWYWVFGVDPIDNGAAGQLGSTERENGETPAL